MIEADNDLLLFREMKIIDFYLEITVVPPCEDSAGFFFFATMSPALENTHSQGTDDAGVHKMPQHT